MVLIIQSKENIVSNLAKQILNFEYDGEYFDLSGNKEIRSNPPLMIEYDIENKLYPENKIKARMPFVCGRLIIYACDIFDPIGLIDSIKNTVAKLRSKYNNYLIKERAIRLQHEKDGNGSGEFIYLYKLRNEQPSEFKYIRDITQLNCSELFDVERDVWIIQVINPLIDSFEFLEIMFPIGRNTPRVLSIQKTHKYNTPVNYLKFANFGVKNTYEWTPEFLALAPTTIIVDSVGMFKSSSPRKTLYYPDLSMYAHDNIIKYTFEITQVGSSKELGLSGYGVGGILAQFYQQDMNYSPFIKIYAKDADTIIMAESLLTREMYYNKTPAGQIADELPREEYINLYKDSESHANTVNTGTIVYYMKFCRGNLDMNHNVVYNINIIKGQLITLYNSKNTNFSKDYIIGYPDDVCYITGVPLYDHYFEVQDQVLVAIDNKTSFGITICVLLSEIGFHSMTSCLSPYMNHLNLYSDSIKVKYDMRDTVSHLRYLFKVQGNLTIPKGYYPKICIKKNKRNIFDVINMIKDEKARDLLYCMEKYGILMDKLQLYVLDPVNNNIYIGIPYEDLHDNLIYSLNKQSDAIIFGYKKNIQHILNLTKP